MTTNGTSSRPDITIACTVRAATTLSASTLAKIAAKAPDPSALEETSPFVWTATVGTLAVDSDGLKLTARSLDRIAAALKTGVAFQGTSNLRELPIGQSYDAERGADRVSGSFYTVPGVALAAYSSDDFIRGVRAGVIRQVRAVIGEADATCSTCGGDPFSWTGRCGHIVGMRYDAKGRPAKDGEPMHVVLDNATLNAVAATYHSADPATTISAVMRMKVDALEARGTLTGRELVLTRMAAEARRVPVQPSARAPSTSSARVPSAAEQVLYMLPGRHWRRW